MGFRGYWFNNSGTYHTNKYPHCYVGIKKLDAGAIWGGFSKYDGTKRVGYGGFSKYNGSIKPAWGVFGGEIVTHTVTTFAQPVDTDFRIETQWHKLEGIATDNATPLYDATGHKMENPNYVIDLYYKIIVPAVGKDATEVFFTTLDNHKHTDLSLLCKQLDGSATFIDGGAHVQGAVMGSNPARSIMSLPSFSAIDNLPVGSVLGNLTSNNFWAYYFQGMVGPYSPYDKPFLNTIGNQSDKPNNLLLSGVSYTDTSITYSINPSFATCGIPVTATDNNKYLMPELRSGFVLIDNVEFYKVDTASFGALYMCLDVHAI